MLTGINTHNCCRLRNGIAKATAKDKEYSNSFGVGGTSIGSHRVVALNLSQIAYLAKNADDVDTINSSIDDNDDINAKSNNEQAWKEYFKILESRIKLAQDILDIHRHLLERLIKNGNLPMYSYGCMNLSKQYSTIGFIGLYEAIEIMGDNITTETGLARAKEIIGLINKLNDERSAKDGNIRNVEQIPGESAAVTFAKKDKLQFANVEYDLYSNQYVPLIKECLLTERIRMQGEFDSNVSGGSILHIDIDNEMTKEQIKSIIQYAAKCNVIYFALDDVIWQCQNCMKTGEGRIEKSPCHQAQVIMYQRVVGFRTPIPAWRICSQKN